MLGSDHFLCHFSVPAVQGQNCGRASGPASTFPVVRDWEPVLLAARTELDIWAAAVQSCSEPVVGLSQRCAKVNELFDDLVRILWDTARLMHPRPPPMHRQRPQPRWWTDECFQALVAKNAAWRDFRRSTSQPTMLVSPIVGSTSTGLSVQPVAVFGDPGKTTFRGCALRTLRRVPVASGGVSVLRPAAPLLMTP